MTVFVFTGRLGKGWEARKIAELIEKDRRPKPMRIADDDSVRRQFCEHHPRQCWVWRLCRAATVRGASD